MDDKGKTEIRELAVCLAIADASTGNGYYRLGELSDCSEGEYGFDVPYMETPYMGGDGQEYNLKIIDYDTTEGWADMGYDQFNEPNKSSLENGYAFCNALQAYGIDIDRFGPLHCECDWKEERGISAMAVNNYKLGLMIAECFELGPNLVDKILWYGPENTRGEARTILPPADIGIKLLGTPERTFDYCVMQGPQLPQVEFGRGEQLEPRDSYEELIYNFYDNDVDIMISLKDGSNVLSTGGFANLANMLLDTEYKSGTDCFELYACEEYDAWFDIAWSLMIDYIQQNGSFEKKSSRSKATYYIYFGEDGIVFEKEVPGEDSIIMERPFEMSREEWMTKQRGGEAKKAFSYWCSTIGNKNLDYISAQARCSTKTASSFMMELASGVSSERWYNLTGWRMASYYYAKISGEEMVLYGVPTIFNAGEFPLDAKIDGAPTTTDEGQTYSDDPLTTQSIVPFSLYQEEIRIKAHLQLVMRFTDGMFKGAPQVQVYTIDENCGTYYEIYKRMKSDY